MLNRKFSQPSVHLFSIIVIGNHLYICANHLYIAALYLKESTNRWSISSLSIRNHIGPVQLFYPFLACPSRNFPNFPESHVITIFNTHTRHLHSICTLIYTDHPISISLIYHSTHATFLHHIYSPNKSLYLSPHMYIYCKYYMFIFRKHIFVNAPNFYYTTTNCNPLQISTLEIIPL